MSKGANGFLLKDCSVEEMIQGISKVNDGGVHFSQGFEAFLNPENNKNFKQLTSREKEIIELVSKGLNNKQIATVLGFKVRTANFHVSNILLKLGVRTRLEAALIWTNSEGNNMVD